MKQHLNTLYITQDESHLSLDGETVAVSLHGERLTRIPLLNLEAIQTFGWAISATPQLMARCAEKGVHFSFCSPNGKLLCNVTGFTRGNVMLRRQQYRLADDPAGALVIAREMVAAKILNARTVLQRSLRDHCTTERQEALKDIICALARSVHRACVCSSSSELLGIEGHAAECYFSVFHSLLLVKEFSFNIRNRRPLEIR